MNKLANLACVTTALGLLSAPSFAALDDSSAQTLMKKSGCATCHAVDRKIVGPAYKDVAAKRKADKDAVALLEKSVRAGSKGIYGPIPMPANPEAKINDSELHDLLVWVLAK